MGGLDHKNMDRLFLLYPHYSGISHVRQSKYCRAAGKLPLRLCCSPSPAFLFWWNLGHWCRAPWRSIHPIWVDICWYDMSVDEHGFWILWNIVFTIQKTCWCSNMGSWTIFQQSFGKLVKLNGWYTSHEADPGNPWPRGLLQPRIGNARVWKATSSARRGCWRCKLPSLASRARLWQYRYALHPIHIYIYTYTNIYIYIYIYTFVNLYVSVFFKWYMVLNMM